VSDVKPEHRFSADRPISTRSEDLLGRRTFAESLASAIKGWKGNDSLVIALYGAWGMGKSSIKNMLLEALRDSGRGTHIVDFNPWQWAGQHQLADAFFSEISKALSRVRPRKKQLLKRLLLLGEGNTRVAKWKSYAAYLKAGSFISSGLRKAVIWLLAVIAVIGIGSSAINSAWFRRTAVVIGIVALILAALFSWFGNLAEKIAALIEAKSESARKDLTHLKDELSGLLRGLDAPVLVVIDDVDRLTAEEILLLFQLLKANADFPNLIYLTIFPRDIVEKSLDGVVPGGGREFLEKIVQVGFDAPKLDRTRLERVLFNGLNELLDDKIAARFERERWTNLFIEGLRPFFANLRDVNRYLSTLAFQIAVFRGSDSFEVNPIDLIALEVLRVFEPDAYQAIAEAKEPLTGMRQIGIRDEQERQEAAQVVDRILEKVTESNRENVRHILRDLFPLRSAGHESYRDLRACHPKIFDRYFSLAIPEGEVSQSDIDRILRNAGNRASVRGEFASLNERGLLPVALERLDAYKETIPLDHAVPLITALFDIGDRLPKPPRAVLGFGADIQASRIVYWILKTEAGIARRTDMLMQAIEATSGFFVPSIVTLHENSRQEKGQDPDAYIVREEYLPELRALSAQKIRLAAQSGVLLSHHDMGRALYLWREWGSAEEASKWVESAIESAEGLMAFLVAFTREAASQTLGSHFTKTHPYIRLANVEDFIPAERIEVKLATINMNNLGDEQRTAIAAFEKAMQRRRAGKPEYDGWNFDDQ
jgi:predicted KAP-like P-loop ATPase